MNQAKPSQAEPKLLYFITSSNLNIICRLVLSSSQSWTFYFCCQVELEHSLLDKTWLIYSPNYISRKINLRIKMRIGPKYKDQKCIFKKKCYFHIFFDKLWCKSHYRKLDILKCFFYYYLFLIIKRFDL